MPYKDPEKAKAAQRHRRAIGAHDCVHGVRRDSCKLCNGCSHRRLKSSCKLCKGSQICIHGGVRHSCKECKRLGIGGVGLCSHLKLRILCSVCAPTHPAHYKKYIREAGKRGLLFDLTPEEFFTLIAGRCKYCERTPEEANGMGIDRVDNSVGYIKSNCVSCCEADNRAKLIQTVKEYIEQCWRVVRVAQRGAHAVGQS